MTQQNSKLVMMRFDPRAGWVKPSDEQIQFDEESPALPASTHEDAVRAQKLSLLTHLLQAPIQQRNR